MREQDDKKMRAKVREFNIEIENLRAQLAFQVAEFEAYKKRVSLD